MSRFLPLAIVFALFLPGCSNLSKAARATAIFSQAHDFGATAVAFSPDSRLLVSGGHQGNIRLWDVQRKSALAEMPARDGAVRALLFLSDKTFASATDNGKLMLREGTRTIAEKKALSPITSLAFMKGHLISGHSDGWLRIWDGSLQETARLKFDQGVVALSTYKDRLAVGLDKQILILDPSLKTVSMLNTGGSRPHDLQFSPDGKTLAAGNWFNLSTWDLATGERQTHRTEHWGLLASVAYSPDGRHIVSLGRDSDSAIRMMDTLNYQVERRYQAHALCGAMIRYSPDGRWIASASDDESVRLYDLNQAYTPRSFAAP
jgi:WD40 repeat protein